MLMGIFVESNEDLGLMYEGYKDIPDIVKKFLGFVHKAVDHASDEGIPYDLFNPVKCNSTLSHELIDL